MAIFYNYWTIFVPEWSEHMASIIRAIAVKDEGSSKLRGIVQVQTQDIEKEMSPEGAIYLAERLLKAAREARHFADTGY